jgi:CDP-diacylglycerol---serine O-phosphatidyltransferase
MRKIIMHVPNTITLLNLFFGSVSIVFALEGELGMAGIFILVAGGMDFLDGFTARLLKAYSEIGKQLDSLADVVSFGVAPAMIAFTLMRKALPGLNLPLSDISTSWWNWFLLLSPFIIPLFSALRLAKFNLDERQTINFIGMPTPANAILWASFGLICGFTTYPEIPLLLFTAQNLLIAVILTSLLLVSELPMFSLKFQDVTFYNNWVRYLFIVAAVLLLIFLKLFALPVIVLLYIAMSVSFYLLKINF